MKISYRPKIIFYIALFFTLNQSFTLHASEKDIYIPQEVLAQDFENPQSQWSRSRMKLSQHFTILWEKGFGDDPSNAPSLNGQSMSVNLESLAQVLDSTFDFYRYTLRFVDDGSNCDKYRMVAFIKYSDETTAYGGNRDGVIGALWLTPVHQGKEKRPWSVTGHEVGHCFEHQLYCDKVNNYFGHLHGFVELCAQWGLWNYYNDWITDEYYHFKNYITLTHKPFFHRALAGCGPYVLEYWSEKYGITFIGQLYRNGRKGEDIVTVYKRYNNMNQSQFCDELFEAFRHTVNLDFKLDWEGNREHGLAFGTDLPANMVDYWQVPQEICPESYGYNALNLEIPAPGNSITVKFEGLIPESPYVSRYPWKAEWRYGFVYADNEGKSHYGESSSSPLGSISFTAPKNASIKKLWLVVMGAPTEHWEIEDDENGIDAQWPYRIKIIKESNFPEMKEIIVEEAGDLIKMSETDTEINTAVSLKIKGNLNGTDILKLRELSGKNYDASSTQGKLQYLDLSDANIVDGGVRYSNNVELDESGTKKNIFPEHAFENTIIRRITLPKSAIRIGRYAFGSCKELEEVIYGDNIEQIDYAAFTYSPQTEIFIGKGVKKLETYAFYSMTNLQRVNIGDGLDIIPKNAFNNCFNLTEVVIGSNVREISADTFKGCENLTTIICRNPMAYDIDGQAFSETCYENATLYVPKGAAHLYRQHKGWKNFKTIKEMGSSGSEVVPEEIRLNVNNLNIKTGFTYQLEASLWPESDFAFNPVWTSSAPEIATVSEAGLVSAISQGEAVITVSFNGWSAQCLVTVTNSVVYPESIVLNIDSEEIKIGETLQLKGTVYPQETTDKTIVWSCDDSSIILLTETGFITGIGVGQANITARCGLVSASCQINVVDKSGIESISGRADEVVSVYSLNGYPVKKDYRIELLKTLPSGVYIIVSGSNRIKIKF